MSNSIIGRKRREEEAATWKAPEEGWYKMNVDGAYNHLNGHELVGCGGLLRNHEGTFLQGFIMNTFGSGNNNSTLNIAQLWGCLLGLKNAWDLGIRKLIVETESTVVQAAIQRQAGIEVAESSKPVPERDLMVMEIRQVVARSWEVRVLVVDRDCNVAARRLARAALSSMPGFHRLHHLPQDVHEVVLREAALRLKKLNRSEHASRLLTVNIAGGSYVSARLQATLAGL